MPTMAFLAFTLTPIVVLLLVLAIAQLEEILFGGNRPAPKSDDDEDPSRAPPRAAGSRLC